MKKDNNKITAWIYILEKQKEREQKQFNRITKAVIIASWLILLIFQLIY
jgi:hypothetical protein